MWGGKECFVATEVKNGVKQMNDSNEREGKCFVVLEGMFFFFFWEGEGGCEEKKKVWGDCGNDYIGIQQVQDED